MTDFLPYIIVGLTIGSLYGLAGLGLVLTFRTSGVFLFGYGALAAGGAFVFYSFHSTYGWPWPLAALVTVGLFAVVVGPLLELVTRPLGSAPDSVIVIGTVGLFLGVQGLLYLAYGNAARDTQNFLPASGFELSGVFISYAQMISFVIAAGGAAGLYVFLQRTRLGIATRAVVDNPRLVDLCGDPPERIRRTGWMIGASVAAIAGILLAPMISLDVFILTFLVIQAFGACAIGAFSSLPLTFVGGLVVGVAASLATKVFSEPPLLNLAPAMPFIVLIVVLLVVPVAKMPGGQARRPTLIAARVRPTVGTHVAIGALMAVAIAIPWVVGTRLPVWTAGLSSLVVFGSLSLLVWGSGQISLCHAAFLAVGTTTMAKLVEAGVPWGIALPLAGLAVVPLGALVALPAVRLRGLYLALATLGLGVFMQNVVYPSFLMFGIELTVSVPRPALGPLDATDGRTLYYLVLVVVVCCMAGILALQRGRFGRLLGGLCESPAMLETHGLATTTTRLLVVCASAFFAGVSGALAVTQTGAASGVTFPPVLSLVFVALLGICGTRRLRSPVLAALLLSVVPGYASSFDTTRQLLIFGSVALIAALLLSQRDGVRQAIGAAAARSDFRRADRSEVAGDEGIPAASALGAGT